MAPDIRGGRGVWSAHALKKKNAYFIFRLGLDGKIYFVPVLLRYCNRALNEREKGGVFVMQSSVPLTLFGLETV